MTAPPQQQALPFADSFSSGCAEVGTASGGSGTEEGAAAAAAAPVVIQLNNVQRTNTVRENIGGTRACKHCTRARIQYMCRKYSNFTNFFLQQSQHLHSNQLNATRQQRGASSPAPDRAAPQQPKPKKKTSPKHRASADSGASGSPQHQHKLRQASLAAASDTVRRVASFTFSSSRSPSPNATRGAHATRLHVAEGNGHAAKTRLLTTKRNSVTAATAAAATAVGIIPLSDKMQRKNTL